MTDKEILKKVKELLDVPDEHLDGEDWAMIDFGEKVFKNAQSPEYLKPIIKEYLKWLTDYGVTLIDTASMDSNINRFFANIKYSSNIKPNK